MKNIDNKILADKLYFNEKAKLVDENGDVYKIEVIYDECPESPRRWDNLCHIICIRGDWDISDEGLSFGRDEAIEKIEELKGREDVVIKPVYMYDHSGQTISLRDFGDRWDSGICGFIYASKEEVFKECMNITEENWKERVYEIMEGEIEIYDQYIRGEVYGFRVYKEYTEQHKNMRTEETWYTTELEEIDSCWGFYGTEFDENGLLGYALSSIPDNAKILEE